MPAECSRDIKVTASSEADLQPGLSLVFPGDPLSVRRALKASLTGLAPLKLNANELGVVEIVLAEVLNNIVEHAYSQKPGGIIELCINWRGERLRFKVLDDGIPLSGGEVPDKVAKSLDGDFDTLPEGGFGWLMIRDLTTDVRYSRSGPRNQLEFSISIDEGSAGQPE